MSHYTICFTYEDDFIDDFTTEADNAEEALNIFHQSRADRQAEPYKKIVSVSPEV